MIIPFSTTDWETIPSERHEGTTGYAIWKTKQYDGLRIRMVEFSENYEADHWCALGHIMYCIAGEMDTILANNTIHTLKQGMSWQVSDKQSSHKTKTKKGCKLFIIDGDFLK